MMALLRDTHRFMQDMGTLAAPVQVWASLYPFPQLIVGSYLTATRGLASPASLMFSARVASFVIAGQVNKRRPMTKMQGPVMHTPFLLAVPLCIRWLSSDTSASDPNMATFIKWSVATTSVSLVLDLRTTVHWLCGQDPGLYKRGPPGANYLWLLPIPSAAMLLYFGWRR